MDDAASPRPAGFCSSRRRRIAAVPRSRDPKIFRLLTDVVGDDEVPLLDESSTEQPEASAGPSGDATNVLPSPAGRQTCGNARAELPNIIVQAALNAYSMSPAAGPSRNRATTRGGPEAEKPPLDQRPP